MTMALRVIFLLGSLSAAQAQQPSVTEQILQQTIGVCVGDNARTVQTLREAQAKIVELEKKLLETTPIEKPK